MSVALSTQRDSVMETTAANVAAAIINQRRAAPDASTGKMMLLPKISDMVGTDPQSAMSGSEIVDGLGQKVLATDPEARFLCQYRVWGWNDPITPHLARVHLRILWPVEIAKRNPDRAESYEVFTMMGER
jgi:hypothetical protein